MRTKKLGCSSTQCFPLQTEATSPRRGWRWRGAMLAALIVLVGTNGVAFATDPTPGQVIMSTMAGNGTAGYSGDGGLATSAELDNPYGVAVDLIGNVYIVDELNNVVREVSPTGTITTIAGNGTAGFSGDNGIATSAELDHPYGVAVDNAGNVYISDTVSLRIRMICTVCQDNPENPGYVLLTSLSLTPTNGDIYSVAGNGTAGFSGDGGLATSAKLNVPSGLAVDSAGNLYIADNANQRIREVTVSTGDISTVAGSGTQGYSGDGGLATSADLDDPFDVAVDSAGNIIIADRANNRIRVVCANCASNTLAYALIITENSGATPTNGDIYTVAGNGTQCTTSTTTGCYDGGLATSGELYYPYGVAVDSGDNLYIADAYDNRIREVTQATGDIATVAGTGTGGYSGDGGFAISAEVHLPLGIGVTNSGNIIYIGDTSNQRVRAASTIDRYVEFAGDFGHDYSGPGQVITSISYSSPYLSVSVTGPLAVTPYVGQVVTIVGVSNTSDGTPNKSYDGSWTVASVGTPPDSFTATANSRQTPSGTVSGGQVSGRPFHVASPFAVTTSNSADNLYTQVGISSISYSSGTLSVTVSGTLVPALVAPIGGVVQSYITLMNMSNASFNGVYQVQSVSGSAVTATPYESTAPSGSPSTGSEELAQSGPAPIFQANEDIVVDSVTLGQYDFPANTSEDNADEGDFCLFARTQGATPSTGALDPAASSLHCTSTYTYDAIALDSSLSYPYDMLEPTATNGLLPSGAASVTEGGPKVILNYPSGAGLFVPKNTSLSCADQIQRTYYPYELFSTSPASSPYPLYTCLIQYHVASQTETVGREANIPYLGSTAVEPSLTSPYPPFGNQALIYPSVAWYQGWDYTSPDMPFTVLGYSMYRGVLGITPANTNTHTYDDISLLETAVPGGTTVQTEDGPDITYNSTDRGSGGDANVPFTTTSGANVAQQFISLLSPMVLQSNNRLYATCKTPDTALGGTVGWGSACAFYLIYAVSPAHRIPSIANLFWDQGHVNNYLLTPSTGWYCEGNAQSSETFAPPLSSAFPAQSISTISAPSGTDNAVVVTTAAALSSGPYPGQPITISGGTNSTDDGSYTISLASTTTSFTAIPNGFIPSGSGSGGSVSGGIIPQSIHSLAVSSGYVTVEFSSALNSGPYSGQPITIYGETDNSTGVNAGASYNGSFSVVSWGTSSPYYWVTLYNPNACTSCTITNNGTLEGTDVNASGLGFLINSITLPWSNTGTGGGALCKQSSDPSGIYEGGYNCACSNEFTKNYPTVNISSFGTASGGYVPINLGTGTLVDGPAVGQWVTISGVSPSSFNGTFPITSVTNSSNFTVYNPAATGSPSGGTVNW